MSRSMSAVVLTAAVVLATGAAAVAQQTSTSTETKNFEILGVTGNQLIVRLPEGTRELTVPNDFRFTVNGQQLTVQQLQVGMNGSAIITTRTTVTPVTVTEVKDGQVVVKSGSGVIVRTNNEVKSFSQSDVDKRGVKIFRSGKPVQLVDLREGDRLSATIVTALPPRIMTEQEVNATLAAAASAPAAAPRPAPAASQSAAATTGAGDAPRTLPSTASSWPILGLASVLSLGMGLALTVRRRFAR